MIDQNRLLEKAEKLGIAQVPVQALDTYAELLVEYNQKVNLTAITDPEGIEDKHFIDSLLFAVQPEVSGRVVDVGTGAGFPGMVLKILVPRLDVTLLDSLNKRLDWLNEVSAALALRDIRTVHARAEETARDPAFREQFDFVTSRAVADLRMLCELCLPYVKTGGEMLAMKSTRSTEEIDAAGRAVSILGGQMLPPVDYTIPGTDITHRLVRIRKIAPTPQKYPRRFAQIKKSPL